MLKKITLLFSIFITGIATGLLINTSHSGEFKNLDVAKQELIQYHDSGHYKRKQQETIDQAIKYLTSRLKQPITKKLAIVLDIDETSLSNFPDMIKFNFGGTLQQDDDAEGDGHDPAIEPTLKLYRFAKANHIAVFFLTGRREHYREGTTRNLKAVGYDDWVDLILKPESYGNISAAPYKIEARKQIENKGYEIVANVGDQESDLMGQHATKTFKMPNPYYIVP